MATASRSIADALPIPNSPSSPPMPQLGLGTYLSPPELTLHSCLAALRAGYRHIDTAQYYRNEGEVGEAIRRSGLPRGDVYVTTKVLEPGPDAYASCLASVERVGGPGGYVDCLLIHSPGVSDAAARAMWAALGRLYREGRARSVGTSNFGRAQIVGLRGAGDVWPPHVNQVELHPWHQQREIVRYCRASGIVVQAYCPIARNKRAGDATLAGIAARLGVAPSQVLIRWSLQKGWVPLPKSDDPARIRLNSDVFGFELGAARPRNYPPMGTHGYPCTDFRSNFKKGPKLYN